MARYKRIKGGEKNNLTGVPFSKDELTRVYELYIELDGKGIHENNPKIHSLATDLGRTVRSVENQLLGFRIVDTGTTGRANYNKIIKEIWDEQLTYLQEKKESNEAIKEERRKQRLQSSEFKFRISSRLKDLIGKELITDDYVAIFELVKNSFDARATEVKLIFEADKITIQDNGKGMDREDIVRKWLFVAYSAKREGVEDEVPDNEKNETYRDRIHNRRTYAGAKGIGRFSTDRLGRFLTLFTRKNVDDSPLWKLEFDWDRFENDAEEEFVDVEISHEELLDSPFPNFDHGVILEINGLHSVWSREKILYLKTYLEKLINPFNMANKNLDLQPFGIEIICQAEAEADIRKKQKGNYNPREIVNGSVTNFIFGTLNIKTTSLRVLIEDEKIITTLVDRGQLIYEIEEFCPYIYLPSNTAIELFYLNQSAKKTFTQLMGITPKDFGSIFLFYNGFRVHPVGDPGDDYFHIDQRKAQGYSRYLGSRELIGSIQLWGNSDLFLEATSRDGGLIDSVGTIELQDFLYASLKRLEKFVEPILWKIKKRTGSEEEEIDLDAKAGVIEMIAELAGNEDIKIRHYSRDFINILDQKTAISAPIVFENLKKIAGSTNDSEFQNEIDKSELEFIRIQKERDEEEQKRIEAESRERQERERRIIAEERAREEIERRKEEEYLRLKAEENERQQTDRRRQAENEVLRKEKERAEAELAKLQAEAIARQKAEENQKLASELDAEKKRGLWQGALLGTDKERIIGLQHQIFHSSGRITRNVGLLLKHWGPEKIDEITRKHIVVISLEATKINSIANFITKANFNLKATEIKTDLVAFVTEYINEVYVNNDKAIDTSLNIRIENPNHLTFVREIRPIEITTLFDNLISNAEKANAKTVLITFQGNESSLTISVNNDGSELIQPEHLTRIFEFGFTTTGGTGIGLFQSRDIVKRLGGEIVAHSSLETGTEFIITL